MKKNIVRILCNSLISIVCCSSLMACSDKEKGDDLTTNKTIEIIRDNEGFQLQINNTPVYIKGVGGTSNLDLAAKSGANAFRTWDGTINDIEGYLALARANNMYLMQGIWLSHDSNDYLDEGYKSETRRRVKGLAEAFKDDPNLLAWGIGNEVDLKANTEAAWRFVDELAQLIKSIDSRHLVSTVISHDQKYTFNMVADYAPSLDFVGINSYGLIGEVGNMVEMSRYKGAFMVTEWGPTGWWESAKTSWGAPIEQTSEEKRAVYEERYNNYILSYKRCLGSFAFLWGQKEERTPTWYSMFVENNVAGLPLKGEMTPMVEAMQRVWSGEEPKQTAPVIKSYQIDGQSKNVQVNSGKAFTGMVMATDKENNTLTYVWEILKEATVLAEGGADEPRPDRVGNVVTTETNSCNFIVTESGNYRLYIYILDNTGFVATVNIPFMVK